MSYTFFDPKKATELAKFQGGFAGVQAGNVRVTGVATAPTSIYNQAGYYVFQDPNTGYATLQKMGNDSLYTNYWYDQGTNTEFDLTEGGKGITCFNQPSTSSPEDTKSAMQEYLYGSGYTTEEAKKLENTSQYEDEYEVEDENETETTEETEAASSSITKTETTEETEETSESSITEEAQEAEEAEEEEQIMLTADDLEDLVEAGVYDNLAEALEASLNEGYGIEDSEQAKLGLYSYEDEKKIELVMEKYGLSRDEAIAKLGNKILDPGANMQIQELEDLFQDAQDEQGMFGRAWNGIKNLLDVGLSSDDVEETIEQFKNGEITYEEAQNTIESYKEKQEAFVDNGGTILAAATSIGLPGPIGLIAGIATKTAIGVTEDATDADGQVSAKTVIKNVGVGTAVAMGGTFLHKGVASLLKLFK